MLPSISFSSVATIVTLCATLAYAQYDQQLVGTWTTKSKKVMTGPEFYNPVADKFIEPELTGISYSFTADGWYEEAYYRAIPNPQQPACPSAILQWQHGRYSLPGNGSIVFEPIAVDGRQQTSVPCSYETSLYIRYHQPELMIKYQVYTDSFHNVKRLDLYQFDGAPMHPMFLAASPPQMLPTQTLNPTSAATGAAATGKAGKVKRHGDNASEGERQRVMGSVRLSPMSDLEEETDTREADKWFWAGVAMVGVGTLMYMVPTSR